jgi:RNA polymerase sigma-70 factor (sigma-E family)
VGRASDAGFTEFVRERSTALLRTAVLLAGGDRGHAEDLLQGVLERMYVKWDRIDGPEAYARRALTHAAVNRWRTRRRRPELPLLDADPAGIEPGGIEPGDRPAEVDLRDALVRALLTLPPRQRAVLVLRYLDDLPDDAVARALGCSVGTVKSQASRALTKLRERSGYLDLSNAPGGTR